MPDTATEYTLPADKTLMILDDDGPFRNRLGRALTNRGFEVTTVETILEASVVAKNNPPAFAVLDMRLEDGNGLDIVDALHESRPDCKMVMLTGYGNLATAVSAVKRGAVDYLAKPADADDVCKALLAPRGEAPMPPENPMSADRVRWEHIPVSYTHLTLPTKA